MTRHLDLKLHYACNNNCIHCVIADQRVAVLGQGRRDFRTTAEVARELADAAGRGFRVVTFTGGEPTLRRDLAVLVRAAQRLGLTVGLQTNGRLLAVPGVRNGLLGLGVRFVVALHGPDAETHDAVTRAPGSFAETMAALRALACAGERVTGKVVISKRNAATLPAIAAALVGAGVARANLTFPHALGNALAGFADVVPRYRDVEAPVAGAIEAMEAAGGTAVTEAVPACLLGAYARCASETAYRESVQSEVRQLDQGPRDWSRDRQVEGKAKGPRCATCGANRDCEGVWREYIEAFGAEEFEPFP